jgi:hypothetical protein
VWPISLVQGPFVDPNEGLPPGAGAGGAATVGTAAMAAASPHPQFYG